MKKVELKYLGAWAKIHNERERDLVDIFNRRMKDAFEYWTTDDEWRETFEKKRSALWWFEELNGMTSAMYFLRMISEPISGVEMFEAVEEQVALYDKVTA